MPPRVAAVDLSISSDKYFRPAGRPDPTAAVRGRRQPIRTLRNAQRRLRRLSATLASSGSLWASISTRMCATSILCCHKPESAINVLGLGGSGLTRGRRHYRRRGAGQHGVQQIGARGHAWQSWTIVVEIGAQRANMAPLCEFDENRRNRHCAQRGARSSHPRRWEAARALGPGVGGTQAPRTRENWSCSVGFDRRGLGHANRLLQHKLSTPIDKPGFPDV